MADIYLDALLLSIYPPLFTSPSGDSCILLWIELNIININIIIIIINDLTFQKKTFEPSKCQRRTCFWFSSYFISQQSWPGTKSLLLHNKNQFIYQNGENEKATHLTCLLTITPRECLATL